MTAPALALRAAIVARCAADADLAALLGGTAAIRDEPAPGGEPVHAHFGTGRVDDWSTSGDRGHEHAVSIVVWGRPGSSASAIAAAGRIAELLDDAPLALDGHRLVQIAVLSTAIERDGKTNLARVSVRLRAATEVLA